MDLAQELLPKVKENLILEHDEDDKLLLGFINASIDYAENYQKQSFQKDKMTASTEQAVIMLSSHFYESRDGSTAGFFANNTSSVNNVWQTVNRLLSMNKRWEI